MDNPNPPPSSDNDPPPTDSASLITQEIELTPLVPENATRPLPQESLLSLLGSAHLSFGQVSEVGMVRNNNQDAAFSFFATLRSADVRPDFGLFVVADGMGGHHDGEKASAMTVNILAQQVTNTIYLPLLNDDNQNQTPINDALVAAVQKANTEVMARVPDGGTTATAAVIIGDRAYVAHVGDSRLYLITSDSVEQLTRDHSLVQRLIELDQLTPEEATEHPQKNVLYRALGQSETVEVDVLTRRLPPKSRLLLCSDGLWNLVESSEIVEVVRQHDNPQEACSRLVTLANKRGGLDNITVILVRLPG
jgi:serine/threonine protein phosphatase PrpC